MKRSYCFSLIFILFQTAFAQMPAIDSMKRSLDHTTNPVERFRKTELGQGNKQAESSIYYYCYWHTQPADLIPDAEP